MDLTIILARFWGIVLVIISIAFLFNKHLLKKIIKEKENEKFIFVIGCIAFFLGAIHVAAYNIWEMSVRGLITLLGWILLIKGAIRIAYPKFVRGQAHRWRKNTSVTYIFLFVFLIIGVYLLFVGYGLY